MGEQKEQVQQKLPSPEAGRLEKDSEREEPGTELAGDAE